MTPDDRALRIAWGVLLIGVVVVVAACIGFAYGRV